MSIYADFCLYLQSKHDQNTTILLDRHGLEMLKMAWIVHVFLRDATTMANFRLVVTKRTPDRVLLFFVISTKRQNRVAKLSEKENWRHQKRLVSQRAFSYY